MEKPLIIEPKTPADSTIIWLHGLGATKRDFEPIAHLLQKDRLPSTRFILPQAPRQAVTLNYGAIMPSWFDIINLAEPEKFDHAQMEVATKMVIDLIEQERHQGIPLERIILAGFSQGGAVVLNTAFLRYHERIGGVLALSTYAPTFTAETRIEASRKEIPSLHLHGIQDPIIQIQFGKAAFEFLQNQGIDAQWKEYFMRHEVIDAEIADLAQWLHARLQP